MAIDINRRAQEVDTESAEFRLLAANIQANILKPHGRDFARHVFIRFTANAPAVRAWIRANIAEAVTSAAEHYQQIRDRREHGTDGGTIIGFFLSASGYRHLGLAVDGFASSAFRKGMKDRSDSDNRDPLPATWDAGFQGDVHALITIADDQAQKADAAAVAFVNLAGAIGSVLTVEKGTVLRRQAANGKPEPVEHFGYFDGISQPLFTRQDLEAEADKNRDAADWYPGAPLSLVLARDPLAGQAAEAYGSYYVYRKLAQDVGRFDQGVVALAGQLVMQPDLAGAMIVGRFKDGTPVVEADTPGGHLEVSNDFNYDSDDDGFRCPIHAHIRKVNPRGQTPLTSLESERKRRIARRGIPYGDPRPGVADPQGPESGNQDAPRGLLFACFQRNIEKQFQFIQRTWVDNHNFPSGFLPFSKSTGDDPLIGQDDGEAQRWPKAWGDKPAGKKRINVESWVALKGGEYFFAPSIAFLQA